MQAQQDEVIVRFLKSSRNPAGSVYNRDDLAGFPPHIAANLIRSREAELADVGKGPGVLNRALGGFEGRRAIESDEDYARRVPAEYRAPPRDEPVKKAR
jgi:hypothetical protein